MGRTLAAYALSCALLALERGGPPWQGASLSALVLLPWLALVSVPRRTLGAPASPAQGARTALGAAALALPPLGLALGLDDVRGFEPAALLARALPAWALVFLWAWAAELARASGRAGRAYSALWLLALPGSAALWVALVWAPRGSEARAPALDLVAPLNPLLWLHGWGRIGGLEAAASAAAPLLSSAVVLAAVLVLRRGRAA